MRDERRKEWRCGRRSSLSLLLLLSLLSADKQAAHLVHLLRDLRPAPGIRQAGRKDGRKVRGKCTVIIMAATTADERERRQQDAAAAAIAAATASCSVFLSSICVCNLSEVNDSCRRSTFTHENLCIPLQAFPPLIASPDCFACYTRRCCCLVLLLPVLQSWPASSRIRGGDL